MAPVPILSALMVLLRGPFCTPVKLGGHFFALQSGKNKWKRLGQRRICAPGCPHPLVDCLRGGMACRAEILVARLPSAWRVARVQLRASAHTAPGQAIPVAPNQLLLRTALSLLCFHSGLLLPSQSASFGVLASYATLHSSLGRAALRGFGENKRLVEIRTPRDRVKTAIQA